MQSETTILPRNSLHVAFATHTGFEHALDYAPSYIIIIMVHATDLRVPGDT